MVLFYDGLCPICSSQAAFIRRRDTKNAIRMVDISNSDFAPEKYGRSRDDFIGSIHAITGEGRMIKGMEVFRHVYRQLGMGWLVSWTAWPGLRPLADWGYRLFARYRPRLSQCQMDRCGP